MNNESSNPNNDKKENPGSAGVVKRPPYGRKDYLQGYEESIEKREEYWSLQSERLAWDKKFSSVVKENFEEGLIEWFLGGRLNGCRNALDVHVENGKGESPALVYLPREGDSVEFSFEELLSLVKRQASALRGSGLTEGDRVALWATGRPESVALLLACSRLGLISVPISYKTPLAPGSERVLDSGAKILFMDGLPVNTDDKDCPKKIEEAVEGIKVVCFQDNPSSGVAYEEWLSNGLKIDADEDEPSSFEAEHPLMLLYAHSSAANPRGSVFATGGYLVGAATSYDQIYGMAAQNMERIGLLATMDCFSGPGLCYSLWGPLLNGHSIVIAENNEEMDTGRLFSCLDVFWPLSLLTTPRMLSRWREELGGSALDHKLRFNVAASCGEMLTPRLAGFGAETLVVSPERMINMWIQNETGMALLSTYPSPELDRPGSVGVPAYGVRGKIVSDFGDECRTNESGQLVFCSSWPSMVRSLWDQEERFLEIYFHRVEGCFATNDGMRIDNDGFFWFMRRLDDVVKVQGHSVSTSEVESVLLSHPRVVEVAVLGVAGEGGDSLVAFVVQAAGAESMSENEVAAFEKELSGYLRERVGETFVPRRFFISSGLPRTKSGKVVRRLLNRIAVGDADSAEDLSYLTNPETVKDLIEGKGD